MFQGAAALTLDAKGRLAIPTRHRDTLAKLAENQLVLTAHPHRCLLIYPAPAWEPIRNKVLAGSSLDHQSALLKRLLVGFAREEEMDSAGRVLIAPELEEKAKKMFGENSRLMPTQNPDDDTNAANPIYGMRYIVMGGGADGFTSKQWAVCDRRLMKELVNIVYNTRPMVLQSPQDNPLKDLYTAYADFGVGWGDARQIIFGDPG